MAKAALGAVLSATVISVLFLEVDRQMAEVRATADGLATRSGVVISASALVASILATKLQQLQTGLAVATLIVLGVSAAIGAIVLVPALKLGPTVSALSSWPGQPSDSTLKVLYAAKLTSLEANIKRLTVIRTAFYAQGVVAAVAIALAVSVSVGR